MLFGDVETIRLYGFCFGPESRHVRYSLVQSVNVETIDDKTLHFLNFGLSFLGSQNDQPHQPWPKSPGTDVVEMRDMCTWILGISTGGLLLLQTLTSLAILETCRIYR